MCWLENNVVDSGEQRRDSAVLVHVSILPQTPLPSRLLSTSFTREREEPSPIHLRRSSLYPPEWFTFSSFTGQQPLASSMDYANLAPSWETPSSLLSLGSPKWSPSFWRPLLSLGVAWLLFDCQRLENRSWCEPPTGERKCWKNLVWEPRLCPHFLSLSSGHLDSAGGRAEFVTPSLAPISAVCMFVTQVTDSGVSWAVLP